MDIDAGLRGVRWCSLAWGDYDNDGDLDLALAGGSTGLLPDMPVAYICRNDGGVFNTAPAAPTGLGATYAGTGPYDVTFSWAEPAVADATPMAGLSYNLRVGTTPGGDEVLSGMADASTGWRRIATRGPIQPGTSVHEWDVDGLSPGTYYWSVQAIDTSSAGGAWAAEEALGLPGVFINPPTGLATTESGGQVTFDVTLSSQPAQDVTLTLSSSDTGEGTIDGAVAGLLTLSFAVAEWDVAQPVTVTGAEDAGEADGNVWYAIDWTAASLDTEYDGLMGSIPVSNQDNDPPDPNLVAWWRFEDGTGNLTALDSVGPNNGTLINMDPATDWVPGKVGGALSFDGVNDHVEVADHPSLNMTSAFTVAVWINPTDWDSNRRIVQKGNDGQQYAFMAEDDMLRLKLPSGTLSASLPAPAQWHHLACTYDGSMMRIYVNAGAPAAEQAASGAIGTTTDALCIGTKFSGAPVGDHFKGLMDDLRIYSRALSTAEIQAIYDAAP